MTINRRWPSKRIKAIDLNPPLTINESNQMKYPPFSECNLQCITNWKWAGFFFILNFYWTVKTLSPRLLRHFRLNERNKTKRANGKIPAEWAALKVEVISRLIERPRRSLRLMQPASDYIHCGFVKVVIWNYLPMHIFGLVVVTTQPSPIPSLTVQHNIYH